VPTEKSIIPSASINRVPALCRAATAVWLLLGSITLVQAEEIYRWVDANGVVNYTQLKPRDVAVQQLTTQAGAPTQVRDQPAAEQPVAASAATPADDELSSAQQEMLQDLRAAEQARQQEIAKVKASNCQKSRQLLSNLSTKNRIRIREDGGQERVMEESERQERIAEAQQGIVENCSST